MTGKQGSSATALVDPANAPNTGNSQSLSAGKEAATTKS